MIKVNEIKIGKKYVIITNVCGDYPYDNGRSCIGDVIVVDEIDFMMNAVWTKTIHHPDTKRSHWYFKELKDCCFLCGGSGKIQRKQCPRCSRCVT